MPVKFELMINLKTAKTIGRELERRGHRFVRYADDCNISVRSERAGSAGDGEHLAFISQKLKLKVNEAQECGGTTAGTKVPRVQVYGRSGHQAHDCAEVAGTVQATNPGTAVYVGGAERLPLSRFH